MNNERLATAMHTSALSRTSLAERLQVDVKTVERWLAGRTPHPRHRRALAGALGQPESYFWPDRTPSRGENASDDSIGFVALYPHRCDVPQGLWRSLLRRATTYVDVLAYAALFLPEETPDLAPALLAKGPQTRVRFALGDPDSTKIAERGAEEALFDGMASRIRMTLLHLRPLATDPRVSVQLHATTLYNSIFRFDDEMLVNIHVYGRPAYRSPVLHLRRTESPGMFDTYLDSFNVVWQTAVPLTLESWHTHEPR